MAGLLVCFRYGVFVLFTICNAVIASVGVWNLSLSEDVGYRNQISGYLVFLGAFALLWIFPVAFIDLLRREAITSRIWFECVWVGLFWVMELSGAAAVSAIVSDVMCPAQAQPWSTPACTSTKVLMAFTWICTITLLVYLVTLATSTIIHQPIDNKIWHASTRDFAWFATRSSLGSAPPSPVSEKSRSFVVAAPRPQRPIAWEPSPAAAFAAIQQLPPAHGSNRDRPAASTSPKVSHQRPILPKISTGSAMPSLYPAHMHSSITPDISSSLARQATLAEPSPSPLGSWPQKTASARRSKRKPPPLQLTPAVPVQSGETDSKRQRRTPRPSQQRQHHRLPSLDQTNAGSVRR